MKIIPKETLDKLRDQRYMTELLSNNTLKDVAKKLGISPKTVKRYSWGAKKIEPTEQREYKKITTNLCKAELNYLFCEMIEAINEALNRAENKGLA